MAQLVSISMSPEEWLEGKQGSRGQWVPEACEYQPLYLAQPVLFSGFQGSLPWLQ